MKKVLSLVALAMISTIMFAVNDGVKADQNKKEAKSGEVIVMNKEMFINDVFDYQNSKEWKYKGDKPAIIDLYADWCGPCRMTAPIMKSLAKEYDGKIVIYKVNVDKEKELAALFNATSIPLFVFIPMEGEPQLFRGAADKATYKSNRRVPVETEIGLNKFNNKKGMVFSTEPCPFYMLPSSLSSLRTNIKLSIKQLVPTSKIGT